MRERKRERKRVRMRERKRKRERGRETDRQSFTCSVNRYIIINVVLRESIMCLNFNNSSWHTNSYIYIYTYIYTYIYIYITSTYHTFL